MAVDRWWCNHQHNLNLLELLNNDEVSTFDRRWHRKWTWIFWISEQAMVSIQVCSCYITFFFICDLVITKLFRCCTYKDISNLLLSIAWYLLNNSVKLSRTQADISFFDKILAQRRYKLWHLVCDVTSTRSWLVSEVDTNLLRLE